MKKILLIISFGALLGLANSCSPKKAASSTTTGSTAMLTKSVAMKQYSMDQLDHGKMLFANSCGKCHKLPVVSAFNDVRWNGILDNMIPKCKVSAEDGKAIRAFVIANSASKD